MSALTDEPFKIAEFERYRQSCERDDADALQTEALSMMRSTEEKFLGKTDAAKNKLIIGTGLVVLFTLQTCFFDGPKKSRAAETETSHSNDNTGTDKDIELTLGR